MDGSFSLEGKVLLITGATSGIGRACALGFVKCGAKIVATGRSAEKLAALKSEISGEGHVFVPADLSKNGDIDALLDSFDKADGAVHCAGIDMRVPIKFSDPDAERAVFETNYFSAVNLLRGIMKKRKIERGGSIVLMSSVSGRFANAGHFAYGNSKAALSAFAREMAVEFAPRKIRVNSISAGLVDSPMTREFLESDSPELAADREKYLLGYGKPEDIAAAARFLLSSESAWITGAEIVADGGYSCQK